MEIKVTMTIETPDYGGTELRREFDKLVNDIDKSGASKMKSFDIEIAGEKVFHWKG